MVSNKRQKKEFSFLKEKNLIEKLYLIFTEFGPFFDNDNNCEERNRDLVK